jgi:hypothetical protein
MKTLIALAVGAGALGVVAAASPAFAQDTAVPPGYIQGSPGYATPGYASGPFGILALPFQIAAAPFEMLVPANGAIGPTNGTLVPASPDCGVWHDWNGRYTALCGL